MIKRKKRRKGKDKLEPVNKTSFYTHFRESRQGLLACLPACLLALDSILCIKHSEREGTNGPDPLTWYLPTHAVTRGISLDNTIR